MGLNNYVAREPRPLPIFVLADTSGSMRGEKINELNLQRNSSGNVEKSSSSLGGF